MAVLTSFVFTNCESNSITPDPDFSDVTWYSNPNLSVTAPTTIAVGRALSIFDLSQGAISHEWSISEGTNFLKPGFKNPTPNNDYDLEPFVDKAKGLSTTDEKVYVYFPTAGDYTVTLKNVFKEKVTYMGSTPVEAIQGTNGDWVFEQVFNITVN